MKKVYEYMGWCEHRYASKGKLWGTGICTKCKEASPIEHHLDGRDMVLTINAMRDKGDWSKYVFYVSTYYYSNSCFFFEDITFSMFGDPAKFFELMEAWIEEVEKDEKAD